MEPETGGRMGEAAEAAERAAERAGAYARSRVTHLSERARHAARGADDRVARLTGRSLEGWMTALRDFVRDHPLQAVAVTVGVGYVLGKLMRRR